MDNFAVYGHAVDDPSRRRNVVPPADDALCGSLSLRRRLALSPALCTKGCLAQIHLYSLCSHLSFPSTQANAVLPNSKSPFPTSAIHSKDAHRQRRRGAQLGRQPVDDHTWQGQSVPPYLQSLSLSLASFSSRPHSASQLLTLGRLDPVPTTNLEWGPECKQVYDLTEVTPRPVLYNLQKVSARLTGLHRGNRVPPITVCALSSGREQDPAQVRGQGRHRGALSAF